MAAVKKTERMKTAISILLSVISDRAMKTLSPPPFSFVGRDKFVGLRPAGRLV
jgi:hypothetical protein